MTVIVDYGMGNLGSVAKAFKRIGAETRISSSASDLESAERLVLPGVGHFAAGMQRLGERGYLKILNRRVLIDRVPILGICLGMQLLARHSEEGKVEGLGWIDGHVKHFDVEDTLRMKIPQMGWNSISQVREHALLEGITEDDLFYFVHSFHMVSHDPDEVLATSVYQYAFTSAVQKGNIFGTQFHPEKSHQQGLRIISNFAKLT